MFIPKFIFAAEDSGSGSGELTVDEISKALDDNADDDKEVLKLDKADKDDLDDDEDDDKKDDDKDEKEEKDEKDDEEKELELKDDDDKPEELIVPVSKKKILAKYPNIFKDFPYLEKAYYADQAYKELLPTIDDAKEVIEKAKVLDGFERRLIDGDTAELLTSIKNADSNAFSKIIDNYLPTLAKVDQGAFNHVVSNVTKQTIMAMAQEAKVSGNEELQKAALILNQFAFGTSNFIPPQQLAKVANTEGEDKIKFERAQFVRERFDVTRDDLNSRIQNTLKSTINEHIDPKGSMTDYVKKTAVREALETTDRLIGNDQQFRKILDRLWERAFESNFSRESTQKIRSAYLSKAKTVLPAIIQKTRNEALRGLTRKTNSDKDNKGPVPSGRPQTQSAGKKTEIPKGMRTIDFLMQD